MSLTVHVPSQAGRPPIESRRARLAGLFPDATYTRLTRARATLGVLAIIVGAVVSLLRTTGTGPLQSIWEEDARDILDGALNTHGWAAVGRPVAGYFVIGPRLLGELTTVFPLSWAAAVLSISAALILAALALLVYCASEPFFPGPVAGRLCRVVVSAPVLVAPVAENRFSEVYNRPVCLHFFAIYALFWVLLWTPATTRGRLAALTTAGLTAVSTILIVGYLPLVALRLAVRRTRYTVALFGLVVGGSVLQALGLWTGLAERATGQSTHADPYWVLRTFAGWGLPTSVLGFRATSGLNGVALAAGDARHWLVVALSWLAVAGVVGLGVVGARRGWLSPRWTLAAAAGLTSLWLYAMTAVANGGITYRYLVPIELLLIAGAVALLRPAERWGTVPVDRRGGVLAERRGGVPAERRGDAAAHRAGQRRRGRWLRPAPVVALILGLLVAVVANYRWTDTYRAHAPRWTDQIRQAAAACRADPRLDVVIARGAPLPWWSIVRLPCHDLLRSPTTCMPPQCEWLQPPVSIGATRGRYDG